MSSATV